MKRSGALQRRAEMKRRAIGRTLVPRVHRTSSGQMPDHSSNIAGAPPRRGKPKARAIPRDYTTEARPKVEREGVCRCGCGATSGLQAAHVIGRKYDPPHPSRPGLIVLADHVVPLARPCHDRYDHHRLNLWPLLTDDEREAAILLVGKGPAERRCMGSAWRQA